MFFFLLIGVLLTLSSTSWFSAWAGLELNLLAFIPLITSKNNLYHSESALSYFLIQALGSALLIFSASLLLINTSFFLLIISISLFLKMGAAPFHFWFPKIMEGLNWPQTFILMTIQKLAPMFLISYLSFNFLCSSLISLITTLSAIVGALGGLNQTKLRKLMAFSSINHMAWMFSAILMNHSSWILYFTFYFFMTFSIIILFFHLKTFFFTQLLNLSTTPLYLKMSLSISLLSLGGLPPFSGFFPKWLLIQEMISYKHYFFLFILLTSALITLYFYLRMLYPLMVLSVPQMKKKNLSLKSPLPLQTTTTFLNLFCLLMPSMFFLL
uniref:NADH-ubiquinone oxidoreductase chain 2 n=1 Tax=Pentacheles validus TaxID=2508670 RepID=A0A410RF33_9EUCA|nr:NADH dehydrogenase subunit 2 [Pentacheles validus]QAT80333.1 NADH dehydrogenase subunit 2 [Pentacheles validus]